MTLVLPRPTKLSLVGWALRVSGVLHIHKCNFSHTTGRNRVSALLDSGAYAVKTSLHVYYLVPGTLYVQSGAGGGGGWVRQR